MLVSERLFVLSLVLCSVVLCENKQYPKRQKRHFLALLGYLHGYKIGQEYALKIPQYLITPVVIVPSVNQQQSVNIQEASNDENYQELGSTIQEIAPAQIVSAINATSINEDNVEDTGQINDDFELRLPKKPNNTMSDNKLGETANDTAPVRLTMESNVNNNITRENASNLDPLLVMNITSNITVTNETIMTTRGPYPLPNYDNHMINSLMLTTNTPLVQNSESLPPVLDNRWQNFTLRANLSNVENITMIDDLVNNKLPSTFSIENVTESPQESKGPYPSAWYSNAAIDQLSITANYYTSESPLQINDGWGSYSYSSMNTLPSGFRPLAGLYYDGFLHTPVKKYGFLPQYYWN